mgnify:CR=1 FL=1|tara:strand:- start:1665 stop:1907 length:243 start_codon:yes stop_codon:yes gene_type:complete
MQKIINTLAVLSFVGVAGIVGGGVYVYVQKDALIKNLTDTLAGGAIGAISDAVPDILDAGLPDVSGPAVPLGGDYLPTMP